MSYKVMREVMEHFRGGGSHHAVMTVLADFADDSAICWPSVATVARRISRSRATAQRILHDLIGHGFLVVIDNAHGGAPGSTRRYRIFPKGDGNQVKTGSTSATGITNATGRVLEQDGYHQCSETGITAATQTNNEQTVNQAKPSDDGIGQRKADVPQLKPKRPRTKAAAVTLNDYLKRCTVEGVEQLPHIDPIFQYAETIGLPVEFLALGWSEFCRDHIERQSQQADWRAHFRNAIRKNWLKLWYVDKQTGEYRLTTAGEQAARAQHGGRAA